MIARARHQIESELQYTLRLDTSCDADSDEARSMAVKACAIDMALEYGEQLERTLGVRGFRAESVVSRIVRDCVLRRWRT
jgi:alkylation response protein AidB-like acyl-CoA dehydrogenase